MLSLKGGLVKTVTLELYSSLSRSAIDDVVVLLNERLAGLTIKEIRSTYLERMKDVQDEPTGIVKLVLKSYATIFSEYDDGRLNYAGTQNIVAQPEFLDQPAELKLLVELLEDENFIVELLDDEKLFEPGRVNIRIGTEIDEGKSSTICHSGCPLSARRFLWNAGGNWAQADELFACFFFGRTYGEFDK